MRLVPIGGGAGFDDQRHGERDGRERRAFHDPRGDLAEARGFLVGRLEDEFVMHLQQHARAIF